MKKIIKYISIILCLALITGCGAKEKKEKELPTNLVESIQIDTTGAATVCTAEYDYSDTQGYAFWRTARGRLRRAYRDTIAF